MCIRDRVCIVNKYDEDEQAIILRFLMDINAFVERGYEQIYTNCEKDE